MSCGRLAAVLGAIVMLLPGLCFFALGASDKSSAPLIAVGLVFFALAGLLLYVAFKKPDPSKTEPREQEPSGQEPPKAE